MPTIIDDSELFTPMFSPVCNLCAHYDVKAGLQKKRICKAFSKEIPKEIWLGKNDHTKPYPGDQGILFKKR